MDLDDCETPLAEVLCEILAGADGNVEAIGVYGCVGGDLLL